VLVSRLVFRFADCLGVLFAAALIGMLTTPGASAQRIDDGQTYPNRAVRIIVPFPPGGPTDILARVLAQRMSEVWGQPVVIENQPGANTAIAAARVAKMPPDGYTLLAAMDVTLVLNPITARNLAYDPLKDFLPISLASKNTSLMSVRAEDGPRTVKELIARAKANPGKLNYGAGILTTRLAGHLFNREARLEVQYIPFNGSAPTVQGLLTGAVDYIIDGAATSLPLVHDGKLRALAKLNSRPLPVLPDLQPLGLAAGLPQLEDMSSWIGLVAPAGTPEPIIARLHRELTAAQDSPELQKQFAHEGADEVRMSSAEFGAFIASELAKWGRVVKDAGIKPQ
jgi:tripartite-type tricarboxylate transporter receptor subunit TctC